MTDQYIDATYIKAHVGTGVHDAIAAITGSSIATRAQAATSLVQAFMRAQGYTPPTSTDGTGVEEVVKLATLGAFWQLAASTPEANIALPEEWAQHPASMALRGIRDGTAELANAPSAADAVGGVSFSDPDADLEDGGRPVLASRYTLQGF